MNSNPNDAGNLIDDFAPPVVNSQVKVKQFIPGQSMAMKKSNVRFAPDTANEAGYSSGAYQTDNQHVASGAASAAFTPK